jgi:putative tricarboxylic transport membrane protein
MRAGDSASGVLAIAFGAAVAVYSWSFPATPGHPVGPAAFPAALGCSLVVAGALLLIGGLRQPRDSWIELPAWARDPRLASNFVLVLAAVMFYALTVDRLGFLITATFLLAILFGVFGVRRTRILPLAVTVTLAIHVAFYTLLGVPLPWGVLERIAW